jgi:predicted chitinase
VVIQRLQQSDGDGVFQYDTGTEWKPSDVYTWPDMIRAVQVMADKGIGDAKLYIGEGDNSDYGMVNIAAFLAQAMQETIRYNACDENNWSDGATAQKEGGEVYSATSACGQVHQSYQDYTCSAEEDALAGGKMACDVDPNMMMRANTQASWYGAPAKLFCAPRSVVPKAPKWNYQGPWCAPEGQADHVEPFDESSSLEEYFDYVNQGGGCRDYQGIKAGGWEYCNGEACRGSPAPLFGVPEGRSDVEGCCWWGRGVIQTTGVCNFGKLNFYMGKRAHDEGRESLYPDVDFCSNPGIICDPSGPAELKWIAGFFYWLNAVQPYQDQDGWTYVTELKKWVDAGMNTGDTSFINGASGIVNRGCYNPPNCGTGDLHGGPERIANFKTVLSAMKFAGLLKSDITV